MKQKFNAMGAEEFLETETATMNSTPNNQPGGNPWVKYIIVGGVVIVSIATGLYSAKQFEKRRNQKFKNYGKENDATTENHEKPEQSS